MSAAEFDPVFQSAGAQYGVDPQILKAIAQQESGFNPKAVNPETGAAGIMQYIPASAKALGLDRSSASASGCSRSSLA
ncbi:transglycosylase SLT domain-containing protein [Paraburkholderia sp. GAS334]|uniref:transglycosylase SLT domain-containing protein n=1 Tax=Paraburkholderia sp. GAS334 TaxID=3035131 RepID=UPI003D21E317